MKRLLSLILCLVLVLSLAACAETPTGPDGQPLPPEPTEEDLALVETVLTDAMARKEEILNSPTEIVKADEYIPGETYTGTAYYVSNNGSDSNDGLSPETPFATLEPFKGRELQFGDAVLFERGGLWRCEDVPWPMMRIDGITYSAYGEGEKPKLYYSPENGADEEKWTLVHEDGEKKIWQFHTDMTEVGAIVLNDDTVAIRQVAWWDGEKYYHIDNTANAAVQCQATEELYDWREHLDNMWCFPELPYENAELMETPLSDENGKIYQLGGPEGQRIYIDGWSEDGKEVHTMGNLYFRCDEGNPGALYEEIEFIYGFMYFDGMSSYTVLDNLAVKYCGGNTVTGHGFNGGPRPENCIVQNCEYGWMGGAVTGYSVGAVGKEIHTANMGCYFQQGGAVALPSNNCTARNNYFHHTFQEATTIELFEERESITGSSIRGNLMDSCGAAIMFLNWDEEVNLDHIITNCAIEDNIVLFTGEDTWFNSTNMLRTETAFGTKPGPCPHDGTLAVRNNVFAFTEYSESLIFICRYNADYAKIYDSNTYIQYHGRGTIEGGGMEEGFKTNWLDHDFITEKLGDTNPTTALVNKEDVDALRESLGY